MTNTSTFPKAIFIANTGVRIGWIIAAYVLLIVIGEVLIVDPLGLLLEKVGIASVKGELAREWYPALGSVIKRIMRIIVILLATHLVLRQLAKRSLPSLGLRFQKKWATCLAIGVGLGALVQIISVLPASLFGWYRVIGYTWQFHPASILGPAFFYAFFFCAETGIIEEVMFRGFLLQIISDRYSLRIAVVISSVVFGLLHFGGFQNEFPWYMSLVSATLAGFLFAQAYLLYGNLWIPIGIHFSWHFVARLLGDVGVGPDEALLLVTEVKGPILLVNPRSGGAGALELVGVAVVSIIILMMTKRHRVAENPMTG